MALVGNQLFVTSARASTTPSEAKPAEPPPRLVVGNNIYCQLMAKQSAPATTGNANSTTVTAPAAPKTQASQPAQSPSPTPASVTSTPDKSLAPFTKGKGVAKINKGFGDNQWHDVFHFNKDDGNYYLNDKSDPHYKHMAYKQVDTGVFVSEDSTQTIQLVSKGVVGLPFAKEIRNIIAGLTAGDKLKIAELTDWVNNECFAVGRTTMLKYYNANGDAVSAKVLQTDDSNRTRVNYEIIPTGKNTILDTNQLKAFNATEQELLDDAYLHNRINTGGLTLLSAGVIVLVAFAIVSGAVGTVSAAVMSAARAMLQAALKLLTQAKVPLGTIFTWLSGKAAAIPGVLQKGYSLLQGVWTKLVNIPVMKSKIIPSLKTLSALSTLGEVFDFLAKGWNKFTRAWPWTAKTI
jgi:hypothetical protein